MALIIKENLTNILSQMLTLSQKATLKDGNSFWQYLAVDYDNGSLVMVGGGDMAILSVEVECEGKSDPICNRVHLKRFYEIAKFMGKDIKLERHDRYITLSKKKKIVKLYTLSADASFTLPFLPRDLFKKKSDIQIKISSEQLRTLKNFVSDDELRPALSRIFISKQNGKTKFAATDSFHLCELSAPFEIKEGIFLSPSSPIVCDVDLNVYLTQPFTVFATTKKIVYQRNIPNEFPEYWRIVDKISGSPISVDRKDLLYSLRAVSAFGGRNDSVVSVGVIEDTMMITSLNMFKENNDEFYDSIKVDNKNNIELTICLRSLYFIHLMDACVEDRVDIYFSDNNDMIYIKDSEKIILAMARKNQNST